MKLDASAINVQMARRGLAVSDITRAVSANAWMRIRRGGNVKPATAGKVAQALGVDIAEILADAG